jgi:transcriptional regulator GlxA family with amidase domain
VSPSAGADLERTVLALASNAEEYWTTQEIADFVGRSERQVYRILAKHARER